MECAVSREIWVAAIWAGVVIGMRVLHLYSGNLYGGVERLLLTLARQRARCPEMEPSFGLCFEGRLAAELRAAGVELHPLGEARFRSPWQVARARGALRRLLMEERGKHEVVVCHGCWSQGLFGGVVREAKLPCVLWMHDVPRGGRGLRWEERWARQPDLVLACSESTQRGVERLFAGVECVRYEPPVVMDELMGGAPALGGVWNELRHAVRAELGVGSGMRVIICVARIQPGKGQDVLLSALKLLVDLPLWECWLVGGAQRVLACRWGRGWGPGCRW
jgi:glycosyltransferase involved in cell wall biosynthesis